MVKINRPGKDYELPYDVQDRCPGPINFKLRDEIGRRMELLSNRQLLIQLSMKSYMYPFKC